MLSTVAILLACVAGIASEYTSYLPSTTEAYPQKTTDYGLNNNIQEQIKRLSEELYAAYAADEVIVARVFRLVDERKENTELKDGFLIEDLAELRQRQANQSAEITDLQQQAETLILLRDEVTVINSTLAEIYRQAKNLAEESQAIESEANELSADDDLQEKRLAAVKARLTEQERKVSKLENVTLQFRDNLENKRKLTENLTIIADKEQGEQVVVVLTKENPTSIRALEENFDITRPQVMYGFSAIHITDDSQSYVLPDNYGGKGYGRYQSKFQNASISFNIDVMYEAKTNEVKSYLIDTSSPPWSIEDITVSITVININNDKLQIDDDGTTPPPAKY